MVRSIVGIFIDWETELVVVFLSVLEFSIQSEVGIVKMTTFDASR
jgi:hypothetical protein